MDKPIIFCDMDGCVASQGKIWRENPKFGISERPPWTAERIDGPGLLSVYKTISDHDSWAIDHFKNYAHIVIISGDQRINEAWAKRRGIPFVFTCAAGFHQDKWDHLVKYYIENFYKGKACKLSIAEEDIKDNYYYLGDAMPDYKCLLNAKQAFVPNDVSPFLMQKLKNQGCDAMRLRTNSGAGCFEAMAYCLVNDGVLPRV